MFFDRDLGKFVCHTYH